MLTCPRVVASMPALSRRTADSSTPSRSATCRGRHAHIMPSAIWKGRPTPSEQDYIATKRQAMCWRFLT